MNRTRFTAFYLSLFLAVLLFTPSAFGVIPGYALDFDGEDDFVFFTDDMGTALPVAGTVEAWVNTDSAGGGFVITRADVYIHNHNYTLAVHSDGHPLFALKEGDENVNIAKWSEVLEFDRWYHLAGTFDGDDVKLYVNGSFAAIAEQTVDPPPTEGFTGIGRNPASNSGFFHGMIDEVRLWDYARTDTEISSTMLTGLTGTESGLTAYWNFNEGTGQSVNDSTSNGNNGWLGFNLGIENEDPTWVVVPEPGLIIAGSLVMLAKLILRRRL